MASCCERAVLFALCLCYVIACCRLLGKGCPLATQLVLCNSLVVRCWQRVVLLPFRLCFVIASCSASWKERSSWLSACCVIALWSAPGKGCPLNSLLMLCYSLMVSCFERAVPLAFRLCCFIAWWSALGKGLSSCLSACVVL